MAGELGFLDGPQHSATLRAVGPTQVYGLRRMNVQYVELNEYIIKQHGRY
jgi:CRP-like cAMP-binding protein